MATGPKIFYEFGPFRVDPEKQVLLRENQPVAITPKTFETLLILVRHSREVVSKDELMSELWPDAFVEEANLSQNIFMLRKALGDTPEDRRYIVTLPGKGYRFVAEVREVTQDGRGSGYSQPVSLSDGYGTDGQCARPDFACPSGQGTAKVCTGNIWWRLAL